jgi:hypothetical protein
MMSDALKQRARAIVVGLAPLVLAAGFLLQPYVANLMDNTELAGAVEAGTTRWAWSQLLIAIGLVLTILAVFAIRLHLRNAGEDRWSFIATPLATIGAGVLVALAGMRGLGGYAVAEAGGPTEGFFQATNDWTWLFFTALVVFSLGLLALAAAVRASGVLSRMSALVVVVALVIGVIASFIPSTWATYAASVVAVIGFWLLAGSIWSSTPAGPPSSV